MGYIRVPKVYDDMLKEYYSVLIKLILKIHQAQWDAYAGLVKKNM